MRKSWTAAAILLFAACTRPSNPLDIPDPSKITHIKVTQWTESGDRGPSSESRIEDRKRIESIIELLRANNTGYRVDRDWAIPFANSSRETYILWFQESINTGAAMSISIGPDWLSGIDRQESKPGQTFHRARPLSGSEREALLALVARRPEDLDR